VVVVLVVVVAVIQLALLLLRTGSIVDSHASIRAARHLVYPQQLLLRLAYDTLRTMTKRRRRCGGGGCRYHHPVSQPAKKSAPPPPPPRRRSIHKKSAHNLRSQTTTRVVGTVGVTSFLQERF
jgi:hypothetical protein